MLGVQGDEIVTILFFATPRITANQHLHWRVDDFNRYDTNTISGETDFFFGCWPCINQSTDLRYPQRIVGVSSDGPFNTISPLFPIQQFMVVTHLCLVTEIAYDPDPIVALVYPSNRQVGAVAELVFCECTQSRQYGFETSTSNLVDKTYIARADESHQTR